MPIRNQWAVIKELACKGEREESGLFAIHLSFNRMTKKKEHVVLRGLITPDGWDENGNVVAIALSSFDEEEYLIDKDETGMELFSLLRAKVQISGIVRNEDGVKRITVETYLVI